MKEEKKSEITDDKIVLYGNYKGVLSIVLGVLAAMALITFLFSASIKSTIVNAQFYKDSLKKADTINKLINEGIPSLIMETSITDNAALNILAKQGMVYVIKNTIPADWVEEKVNLLIDDTVKFISESSKNPKLIVNLNELQTYLTQIEDGLVVLQGFVPSCEDAKANQNMTQIFHIDLDCSKMNYNLDQIKADIEKGRAGIDNIKIIEADLTDEIKKGADFFIGINNFAKQINTFYYSSLIVLIISLVLIIIFQFKNIYKAIKYTMIPIASGSAVILLAALFTKSSAIRAIEEGVKFPTTPQMQQIVYDLLDSIVLDRYNSIIMTSSIILGVSLAVLVASILIHRKHK